MFINELKNALNYLMRADVVPFLWGSHGIGKTTAVKEYADEGGHKLFTLALGNIEIPDILGVMDRDVDQYTGKAVAARYLMPTFFKELIDFATANPDKYAILFLDELNHARKDVLSPVFQMITSKSIHTTPFPNNFRIIAASNPPTDDYSGVLNLRNQALLDRFCHITCEPSVKGWLSYTKSHADITGFIQENGDALRCSSAPFRADQYAKPSERSWELVDRLYKLDAPRELIYGMVGTAVGVAWFTWLENQKAKTITGEDIFEYKEETRAKVRTLVEKQKWAEVQKVVDAVQLAASKKTNELHELFKEGKDPTDGRSPAPVTQAVAAFLLDLPDEIFMSAYHVLGAAECRYLAYTVFDDDKIFERFKGVVDANEAKEKGNGNTKSKKK